MEEPKFLVGDNVIFTYFGVTYISPIVEVYYGASANNRSVSRLNSKNSWFYVMLNNELGRKMPHTGGRRVVVAIESGTGFQISKYGSFIFRKQIKKHYINTESSKFV